MPLNLLGVTDEAVDINIKFIENIAKWKEVGDEKRGCQSIALGNTCNDGERMGSEGFQLDKECT